MLQIHFLVHTQSGSVIGWGRRDLSWAPDLSIKMADVLVFMGFDRGVGLVVVALPLH